MTTLKNAQDLDRSNRMKDLAKGIKDLDELAQHRRRENKKHVEQSVEERQKVEFIIHIAKLRVACLLPATTFWKIANRRFCFLITYSYYKYAKYNQDPYGKPR